MTHASRAMLAVAATALLMTASRAQSDPTLPQFENPNGPNFLDGVIYGYTTEANADMPEGTVNRAGVIRNSLFTYTRYTDAGPVTQLGQYLSWECVDPDNNPGEYRAIVLVGVPYTTDSGALAIRLTPYCEYGVVDPLENSQKWAWGDPGACPNATERINYRDWTPSGLNFTCGVAPAPELAAGTGFTGSSEADVPQTSGPNIDMGSTSSAAAAGGSSGTDNTGGTGTGTGDQGGATAGADTSGGQATGRR